MRTVISQTQLDVATDSYQPNSIKMSKRQTRGLSSKIHIINSSKSRVRRSFANFLSNGENKERMVEITFSTLQEKNKSFELLEDQPAYHLKSKSL